jgi:hypothetical protein
MLIIEGGDGDGVGKEQLPSKTRLIFEDKVRNGVWCDEEG